MEFQVHSQLNVAIPLKDFLHYLTCEGQHTVIHKVIGIQSTPPLNLNS